MPPRTVALLRPLALLAAAGVCAVVANRLAPPERRLAWTGWAPPPTLGEIVAPAPAEPALALPPVPAPMTAVPAPAASAPAAPKPAALVPPRTSPALPAPPASQTPAPETALTRFPPSSAGVMRDITSAEAWAAFQLRVPFLDARRSAEYAEGHVRGAWPAPVWEAGVDLRLTEFEARANPAPRAPLVLYCGGGECEDSHLLAKKLVALGYRNLLLYRGGYPDWTAQGRPTAAGAQP